MPQTPWQNMSRFIPYPLQACPRLEAVTSESFFLKIQDETSYTYIVY
jgi:hypothetical protein